MLSRQKTDRAGRRPEAPSLARAGLREGPAFFAALSRGDTRRGGLDQGRSDAAFVRPASRIVSSWHGFPTAAPKTGKYHRARLASPFSGRRECGRARALAVLAARRLPRPGPRRCLNCRSVRKQPCHRQAVSDRIWGPQISLSEGLRRLSPSGGDRRSLQACAKSH